MCCVQDFNVISDFCFFSLLQAVKCFASQTPMCLISSLVLHSLQLPVLKEAWGLHLQETGTSGIREMAVWLNSDTAKHKTSCCPAPSLPLPIPSPVFHSVLITFMSYQSYILGETQKGEWEQSATTTEVFSQIANFKDETRRHRYLWFWWKDIISQKSNFQFTAPKQPLKPTRWELAICHTVVSHKLQRRDLWTFSLPWWSVKHPQCTHPSSPHSGTCRCTLTLFCHSPIVKRRKKAFPKFLQSFWEESSTWDVCSVKITEYCKYTKAAVPECASCICTLKETRGSWSGTTRTFLITPRKIT